MSYILEALADSEQARQQIAAAPKYSLLSVVGEDRPLRRLWPYVLGGAVLVNVAVLQVWLHVVHPGGAAPTNVATVTRAAQTPLAPESGNAPLARHENPAADLGGIATLRDARPPQSQAEPADERRVAPPPAPADALPMSASANPVDEGPLTRMPRLAPKVMANRAAEAVAMRGANPTPTQTPTPTQVRELAPRVIAKRGAAAAIATEANQAPSHGATPSQAVAGMNPAGMNPTHAPSAAPTATAGAAELPPVVQKEMPTVSVAGFIRGEGSNSMVIVNDRLVREGDEVAPGVTLEKILSDSVEFSYKGYRFKR